MESIMINVNFLIIGLSPDNFCTYCCVSEFGNQFQKEKMECLDKCLKSEFKNSKAMVWEKIDPKLLNQ